MEYLPVYWALLIFIGAFALLVYAFVDNKNQWRLHVLASFMAGFLFFYLGAMFNGAVVQQDVGGSLVVVQPPYLGMVLWAIGTTAVLLSILFFMDWMLQVAGQRRRAKADKIKGGFL